jgi:signal transduction histidine kinase
VVFASVNIVLMFSLPGRETIPFHFVWISFALVHGLQPWRTPYLVIALLVITITTFWALLHHALAGYIGWEETTEVPLMGGLFLVMVWHVRRRQVALDLVEELAAVERRRAEAQLLFIRLGSHELRTPITIARGYTELIRAAHADPETVEDTDIVLDELAKLERITARLLTLLLVEGASATTPVNLDDELERIIRRWEPTADRQWSVESVAGTVAIRTDRLETAIDSLIDNAIKFTQPGDAIRLRAWKASGEIFIEVSDTGSGICAEDLPLVFDHFRTGREAGDRAGTGLGLPIVRAALAGRGGTIDVTSEPGSGTVFLMRMPERPPSSPPSLESLGHPSQELDLRRRSGDRPLSPA